MAETDTPELDNAVMPAEEFMQLWPDVPINFITELCRDIQDDSEKGYY